MNHWPHVTILMPIRNEAGFIASSLHTVLAQDYPPDRMEIIVIDGMSDDGTREIVQQIMNESPPVDSAGWIQGGHSAVAIQRPSSITLVDNPARIVPTALNIGLRRASGEVIIRVDGHCEIASDYVRRCVEALEQTGADCVGGPMVTVGETSAARGIALAQSSIFGVGGVAFRTGQSQPSYVDTVAFGAYRKSVFERIGGFDEELVRNQDDEFNFRLIQVEGKIWLDPRICSRYHSRATLRGLWRQYFQYGLYKVRVIQKRGAVPSWRHVVPAAFVLALLASAVLALVTRKLRWTLVVVAPYVVVNLMAGLWTARRDWSVLLILPLAFATLHLAYGIGFLWGLWKWRGR